ncbi:MAG TPA: hypothetical protein VJ742_12385 [Nitrososphaera sp.]|nr:hypothetical protein [Nitrososphaera sp.]
MFSGARRFMRNAAVRAGRPTIRGTSTVGRSSGAIPAGGVDFAFKRGRRRMMYGGAAIAGLGMMNRATGPGVTGMSSGAQGRPAPHSTGAMY